MRVVIVMGVCGCGKSTIGLALARRLECEFLEGDSLHPTSNIQKMANGIPLNDEDRLPWLEAMCSAIESQEEDHFLVVACSALKRSYREVLLRTGLPTTFVLLDANRALLTERLRTRTGHFLPPTLLDSQLAILEPPIDGLIVDAAQAPGDIVATILRFIEQLSGG